MSFSEVFVLGIGVVRQSRPTTQSSLARAPSRARPSSIVSVLSSFGHSLSLLTICPIMDYGRRGGRSGNGLLVLVVGIARLQSQQRKSRRSELVLSAYLVSGIWYIAQAQSFIRFSMGNPSGTRGARTSTVNLFVAVPAIMVTFVLLRICARFNLSLNGVIGHEFYSKSVTT